MTLVVLGCLAEKRHDELRREFPQLDLVLGIEDYPSLPGRLGAPLRSTDPRGKVPSLARQGVCAYLAIMRGCDNFCSYCIVPLVRGREICRPPEEVLAEGRTLVESGSRQITLVGQNVNSYRWGAMTFEGLLGKVAEIPGLSRLRFLTSHPRDLKVGVLRAMAEYPQICKSLHLPLQSGSDRILTRMNRGYTSSDYLQLVEMARRMVPGVALSTDVMVGFPGETKADFDETLRVVREVEFHSAYMYGFSARAGTQAALFPDPYAEARAERLECLIAVQQQITRKKTAELIGRTVLVLVEKESRRAGDQWVGMTGTNIPVVFPRASFRPGDLASVAIVGSTGPTLIGARPAHPVPGA